MKNIQTYVEESVDEFIGKLQKLVGEFAVCVIEQRLTKRRKKQRRQSPSRSPDEIKAIVNELYAQICKQPGATMISFSKAMNRPSPSLTIPIRKLVAEGKVKKTGQRSDTRYFPVGRQAKLAPERSKQNYARK